MDPDQASSTIRLVRARQPGDPRRQSDDVADALLGRAGRGDTEAFTALYDLLSARVYGLVRQVVRDTFQSEEVTQEVFVDVWRRASHFDPARGSATTWVLTIAHRRAVDRVRSAEAATQRELRAAALDPRSDDRGYDDVTEQVETRLEHQRLRHCLRGLTPLQRESITLAYYSGYTYREVSSVLEVPLGTVKTRMRDGLIRLRDCLAVGS